MIGGLLSKTSRAALFAAAGLFAGGVAMPSAKAADLGGDCCADLEERVAELEATTARKGNRRVSLTVYGWVNEAVMYWNDGRESNTYFGTNNLNYGTRFGLRGDARINPNLTAGFNILIDMGLPVGANTLGANQRILNTPLGTVPSGATSTTATAGTTSLISDVPMRVRDMNVWIESKQLGRLTVGHQTAKGPQGIVDLAGTAVASTAAIDLYGGGLLFRNSATGAFSGASIINNTTNQAKFGQRVDAIGWDSPTFAGFVVGLTAGGAAEVDRSAPVLDPGSGIGPVGLYWAANIRYAGEWAGFRVAAAAGIEVSDANLRADGTTNLATVGGVPTGGIPEESKAYGYSASVLHISSGLFAQGSYLTFERGLIASLGGGTNAGTLWQIQGGVSQNWFGIGKTVLYGEYARGNNLQQTFSNTGTQVSSAGGTLAGAGAVVGDNEYTMWGLGIVQNIDAAALEIYLAYRNHSLNNDPSGRSAASNAALGFTGGASPAGASVDDIQTVMGGMRIAF